MRFLDGKGYEPPEVAWLPPPDWAGVKEGACRLPELFEELDEFEELEPEPELAEPDPELLELLEPEPRFAVPLLDAPLLAEDPPVRDAALPDEPFDEVVAACVEPGSTAARTPAAATLAKLTVTVAVFSRRLPRSRSATARERLRAAPCREPDRPRGDPSPSSWLLMLSVLHTQL